MKLRIAAILVLAAALLGQLTIINGLPLPGGGEPDLVLLCVVAIGLVAGQQSGLIAGFCAGLALDLAPPATELVGQYALVFCLVGYLSGRLSFTLRMSAVLTLVAGAAAAVAGEVLVACLVLTLDTPEVTSAAVAASLPASVLYDVVLSPVVIFAAVRLAIALGASFNLAGDSPALEVGGSAQPMGLAGLARLRRARNPAASEGMGAGASWLTGDSVAAMPAVGTIGWLSGPPTTRKARREQARLTAALTGAEPRKGDGWVGGRPAGLRPPGGAPSATTSSGLARLRPESGVAGSATREGQAGAAGSTPSVRSGKHGGDGLPKIAFGSGSAPARSNPAGRSNRGGRSGSAGRAGGGPDVPKIAFGTGPGKSGHPANESAAQSVPKISFGTGGLPGTGRAGGRGVPKIRFGNGGRPGGGKGPARRTPKIAFGTGLPRAPRTSSGRPALPRFGGGAGRSAAGSWLAGSRFRSVQSRPGASGKLPSLAGGAARSGAGRVRRPKAARWRRKRGYARWLPFRRRAGGRSTVWRIGRQIGGER